MTTSFNELKRSRSNDLEKLNKELTKINSQSGDRTKDDRFWSPTVDKVGNGYAVIRFLPAPPGEDVPFVRVRLLGVGDLGCAAARRAVGGGVGVGAALCPGVAGVAGGRPAGGRCP